MGRDRREDWDVQVRAARATMGKRHPWATLLWAEKGPLSLILGASALAVGVVVGWDRIWALLVSVGGWLVGVLVPASFVVLGTALFAFVAFMVWRLWGFVLRWRLGLTAHMYTLGCAALFLSVGLLLSLGLVF